MGGRHRRLKIKGLVPKAAPAERLGEAPSARDEERIPRSLKTLLQRTDDDEEDAKAKRVKIEGRKEGESLRQFRKRVDLEAQTAILEGIKKNRRVSQKKREYRQTLREKDRERKEERAADRIDDFAELKDEVKFGEVVERPPQITVVPKPIVKAKLSNAELLARRLKEMEEEEEGETADAAEDSLTPKQKKQVMDAAAQKRQMELMRERVIASYRAMRKTQSSTRDKSQPAHYL